MTNMTLTDRILVLTGRKLSQNDIEKAENGTKKQVPQVYNCAGADHVNLYREGYNLVKVVSKYAFVQSPDTSDPKFIHQNWVLRKSEKRMFDQDGMLREKVVYTNCRV
jgi:hypothetical protein